MIIYLIGYMGSGKTTVGKQLAKRLNYELIDLDHLFEETYNISVSCFFKKYDEDAFRQIESKLLKEVSLKENVIISTGGGAPCFFDNMKVMKNTGAIIYLKMAVKSLVIRLLAAKEDRPLIKNLSEEELYEFIEKQLTIRSEFYEQAHLVFKGENCDVDELVGLIKLHPEIKK
jgi:shikimate kinase